MTKQVQQIPILPLMKCRLKVYILLSNEMAFFPDHGILTCGGTSVP